MRKTLLLICSSIVGVTSAQNLTDALRYSVEDLNGTARYRAMSGAFGALGGDLSAISVNPAGSAVFSTGEITFTLGGESFNSKNTLHNTTVTNKYSNFTFDQFGVVFSIPNTDDSDWKKFALSFNYQTSSDFNRDFIYGGSTTGKNLGDYFQHFANGIAQQDLMLDDYENKVIVRRNSLTDIYDAMGRSPRAFTLRNALLGYTVGLVDPQIGFREIQPSDSDQLADNILAETNYINKVAGVSTKQNFDVATKGGIHKYNFSFATQYGDDIYLGLGFNAHTVDYSSVTRHYEGYDHSGDIKNAYFRNELKTLGNGISFQLGAIAKATKDLRLGVSYTSPTWYTLQDETTQYIETNNRAFFADPRVVVVYDEYKFRTPGSWTASAAYIFGKNGLISFDYIYKGYGKTYFRTENLKSENTVIQNELGDTSAIRLGGEYRIKALSLRAGIRHEQSPYKTGIKYIGDLTGYSLGLGYALGGVRFDLSYDVAKQDNYHRIYESVLTTPAKMTSTRSNILLTMSIKLF
ncbi:OmpP1/FadL family transporter [Capnocytophaga canis]|uniref:OmpP1/FadL family transporter n=1 Tax=Capnocytophaga canis TaxID=1848903 RepID=UPI0037CE729C